MKKIKWLIQDVGMKVSQLHRKFDALEYLGEDLGCIGVIPDHPYITNLENVIEEDLETKYVLLSGVKVLNLLKKANHISEVVEYPTDFQRKHSREILDALIEGVFYDYEKFDQAYYAELDLPLLNSDAEYIPVELNLNTTFSEDKFVKPSRDLKAFDAGILSAGQTVKQYIESKPRQRFYLEEKLVVSSVKEIVDEYRFFVVNKEVVGGSAYRENGVVGVNAFLSETIWNYADKYALLYQPADIFTMDLVKLKNSDIRIVEYNCFNCSGVYLCDMINTFRKIKEHILKEDSKND